MCTDFAHDQGLTLSKLFTAIVLSMFKPFIIGERSKSSSCISNPVLNFEFGRLPKFKIDKSG